MIVAVLLLAVGALATAAAHVSRSGTARGDIALVDPVPDKAAKVTTPEVRTIAPLFAGGSAANTTTVRAEAGGTLVGSAARSNGRRFDLVSDDRRASSSYRDFAGERSQRGNSPNGSGGSAGSGGGGIGGGGGAWGGASGTASAKTTASTGGSGSTRAATTPRQSSGSGSAPGAAGAATAPGLAVAVTTPAAANSAVIGGVAALGPVGSSPGAAPTPEPLTLLLVGSGLAGLYGVRKHIAG